MIERLAGVYGVGGSPCSRKSTVTSRISSPGLPSNAPVIAVGATLLPVLIAEAGIPLERALWMVPTGAFQRHRYGRREWRHDILRRTSDPTSARGRRMERDAAFAREIVGQARDSGGRVNVVDGTRDVGAIERDVRERPGLAQGDGGHGDHPQVALRDNRGTRYAADVPTASIDVATQAFHHVFLRGRAPITGRSHA